jgi:hypothetical protein
VRYISRLNGWERFWLVITVIWFALCIAAMDWKKPGQVSVQHWDRSQPDLTEIKSVWMKQCDPSDGMATLWGFSGDMDKLPHEISAPPSPGGIKFTPELYCEMRFAWTDRLFSNSMAMIIPPIALLILGLAIAWIRQGFRQK